MSNQKSENKGKLLAGMILGGAIGATLGLLFAPAKGEETRKKLKKKTDKLKDDVVKKAGEIKSEIQPVVDDIKEGLGDFAKQVNDSKPKRVVSKSKSTKKS